MVETMIERVAKIIDPRAWDSQRDATVVVRDGVREPPHHTDPDTRRSVEIARAIITAMREPTDAMSTRGDAAAASLAISNDSSGVYTWQVMIDEAMEEGRL